MSGTWKEKKRSTPWLNFDATSKFCGEEYIGSSRLNIYRFSFATHLQMAHELSRKVYNVKACLLRQVQARGGLTFGGAYFRNITVLH